MNYSNFKIKLQHKISIIVIKFESLTDIIDKRPGKWLLLIEEEKEDHEGEAMRTEKVSSQSSDKLMQILECLAEQKLPMRLQDLAEAVGMTQPTVLRYLNSLVNSNYIYQDPESLRYGLTWKVCALGANLGSYASMRSIANRFVTQLSMRFGLGACLVVEENGSCVYLDCIDSSPVAGRILQHIGRRSPLHTASSGKILLASHSDEEVDRYIAEKGLERLTDNTITSREALFAELELVRSRGWAFDDEECEIGLRCVSRPLRSYTGGVVAAMSVFGDASEMTPEHIEKDILPHLTEATEEISRRLGWPGLDK